MKNKNRLDELNLVIKIMLKKYKSTIKEMDDVYTMVIKHEASEEGIGLNDIEISFIKKQIKLLEKINK